MRLRVRVEGSEKLTAQIRAIGPHAVEEVGHAVRATLVAIEAEAKRRCPVRRIRGGRLRASITHEQKKLRGVVGTNVHYAPYVEFGTYKMAARPYLQPAAESERKAHTARVRRALVRARKRAGS